MLVFFPHLPLTFYFIGLQVQVLQSGGHGGNSGEFVVRQIQLHQAGVVEGLRGDAEVLQAAVTQTQVLEVEESLKTVLSQSSEGVV